MENLSLEGYAMINKNLLERILKTTAINLNCGKVVSVEDQWMEWINHYNIKLSFESWEEMLVDQGFASQTENNITISNSHLGCVLNLNETEMSLDGTD